MDPLLNKKNKVRHSPLTAAAKGLPRRHAFRPSFHTRLCAILFLQALAALPAICHADGNGSASGDEENERNRSYYYLALGTALTPDYDGSNRHEALPLIIARWMKRGRYVEMVGAKLRANLIAESLWQFGPVLRWRRARSNVGSHAVSRMEHIDGALEAGGFFGATLRDPNAPERSLGVEIEVMKDVWGVHNGYLVNLEASGGLPFRDKWMIHVSVNSSYGSGNYMQTYFGVNASDALRSGLPTYTPEAGFKDVGVSATLSYSITDHWGVSMTGYYQRLINDAADSPVVARVGSPNQFTVTLMGTYLFF
jgi:outer membrane protein